MSRFAARGRTAADQRPERRRSGRSAAATGAFVLALGLIPAVSSDAAAQSRSGIYINNDVLNSLGPGPEAAPLAPLAPAAPPTPLSPRSSPVYQAPLVPPAAGNDSLGFEPYGSGNFVVTRPGTLLFPPLHEPDSTLTPGFAGEADNHAARARALDNAFAEGPEPSSQLLIPLDPAPAAGSDDSVIVFMENLPPADPDADAASAPVLTLQQPPLPAPRKPAVPAEMVAVLQEPEPAEAPAELAPEFAAPAAPAMAALPPEAPVERAALAAPEPRTAEPEVVQPAVAETGEPEAAATEAVDETPAPMLAQDGAAKTETVAAASSTLVTSAEVPAPVAAPLAAAEAPSATDAPVSLLPAAAETPGGVQTASLAVGTLEDRSLLFEVDSAELSPEAQTELRALADALRAGTEGDIQVLGFASGQDGSEDQARKLALSRALKVRSFLIDAGIASARIRVRSLGDRAEGGPANRVDIKPIGS